MASYHESVTPTATEAIQLRPYEYTVLPPIGYILQKIREHCTVGGTIRASVRKVAEWAEYRSAGQIAPLLQQLHDDGWIIYDPASSLITLLAESQPISAADRSISDADQSAEDDGDLGAISAPDQAISVTDRSISHADRSEPITTPDRISQHASPILQAIRRRDRSASRMEDHVLAAAVIDSDSAAARSKIPCAADSISTPDRFADSSTALVLTELGADPVTLAEIATAQPELMPGEILPQWEIAQERERTGYTPNARQLLFGVLKKPGGRLYGRATGSPTLNPAAYADDPQYLLASQPPASAAETLYERAQRLIPPGVIGVEYRAQMDILMRELAAGASDDQALDALAVKQTRRGGP